ncbi:hypothetical protein A4X06_0g9471 [Tilletia controversa]|uniref:CCHC-type domain-containing protein n=1 Tax=Tilletia controversa TaxID=13291 RepID=A0A8X7SS22_9BASI|nr:hypothetical protein A4X06_0g9471 [Tilletia controversa]
MSSSDEDQYYDEYSEDGSVDEYSDGGSRDADEYDDQDVDAYDDEYEPQEAEDDDDRGNDHEDDQYEQGFDDGYDQGYDDGYGDGYDDAAAMDEGTEIQDEVQDEIQDVNDDVGESDAEGSRFDDHSGSEHDPAPDDVSVTSASPPPAVGRASPNRHQSSVHQQGRSNDSDSDSDPGFLYLPSKPQTDDSIFKTRAYGGRHQLGSPSNGSGSSGPAQDSLQPSNQRRMKTHLRQMEPFRHEWDSVLGIREPGIPYNRSLLGQPRTPLLPSEYRPTYGQGSQSFRRSAPLALTTTNLPRTRPSSSSVPTATRGTRIAFALPSPAASRAGSNTSSRVSISRSDLDGILDRLASLETRLADAERVHSPSIASANTSLKQQDKRDMSCFRCHQTGHLARDCPLLSSTPGDAHSHVPSRPSPQSSTSIPSGSSTTSRPFAPISSEPSARTRTRRI